jgi:hypothetical protein
MVSWECLSLQVGILWRLDLLGILGMLSMDLELMKPCNFGAVASQANTIHETHYMNHGILGLIHFGACFRYRM